MNSNAFRWQDDINDVDGTHWGNQVEPDPGDTNVKFTSFGQRLGAICIDWGVPFILFFALHGYLSDLIVAAMWINMIWVQGKTGQSLGKKALGIKLAYIPEQKTATTWTFMVPGVPRCLLRYVLHVLDFICFIGFFKALLNPWGRSFADALTSCVVIADDRFDLVTMDEYRRMVRRG